MAKILNVHESENNVLTESVVNGIDTTNILYSGILSTTNITVDYDCIAICLNNSNYQDAYSINDVKYAFNLAGEAISMVIKKGQQIKAWSGNSNTTIILYGIKR